MSEQSEFYVYCPHCGADNGHYGDFMSGLGDYYVAAECDACDKPFAVDFEMRFTPRAITDEAPHADQ